MDGVSAIFAVVSLGIQLGTTVKDIHDFIRDIRDAPEELLRLTETSEQLFETLKQVQTLLERQTSMSAVPDSFAIIASAVRGCEKRVKKLECLIKKLQLSFRGQHHPKKALAAFRTFLKKDELLELRHQLHEDITALQLSISINSTHLQ